MATLKYKHIKLEDGEDRKVTRREVRELTGLSNARLSQLVDAIPAIGRRGLPQRGYCNEYSLRMVIRYILNYPVNETKQRAAWARKGKASNGRRTRTVRG